MASCKRVLGLAVLVGSVICLGSTDAMAWHRHRGYCHRPAVAARPVSMSGAYANSFSQGGMSGASSAAFSGGPFGQSHAMSSAFSAPGHSQAFSSSFSGGPGGFSAAFSSSMNIGGRSMSFSNSFGSGF